MAGPTDILTEDVKDLREANRVLAVEIKGLFERLSADLRDSNQRLAETLREVTRDLGSFRVEVAKELGAIDAEIGNSRLEVAKELGDLRTRITKDLGTIDKRLEKHQSRTDAYLSVARYVAATATVVVLGLIGWSDSAYARAVRIEQSVIELRQSVVELREHAKEQDDRISKLIELQQGAGKAATSKTSAMASSRPDRRG